MTESIEEMLEFDRVNFIWVTLWKWNIIYLETVYIIAQ